MSTIPDVRCYPLGMNEEAENINLTWGEWLRDQLFERGYNQVRFAAETEASQSSVSAWVNGRVPTRFACYRIAAALGLPRQIVLKRAGLEIRSSEIDPVPDDIGSVSELDIDPVALEIWAEGTPWLEPEDWETIRSLVRHLVRVKKNAR